MLNLSERLFLLTIDDEKGKVVPFASDRLNYGLVGAVLAELMLDNKIAMQEKNLVVVDDTPTDDPLLDEVLSRLTKSKRLRRPEHWINSLASRKLKQAVVERLVSHKVILEQEKRFLWVIPYQVYPQLDASAKYWVKQRLRDIVLAGEKPEPDQVVLLSLLKACDFLDLVFTREERKAASKIVKSLIKGDVFGEAVAKVIADIDAAVAAAVVIAVAASN